MSTYLIGDVQGCFQSLQALLKKIAFNPSVDRLGFAGDLVSRGPQSLETLRFIQSLNDPIVVLGNHDLHCLALGYDVIERDETHSLQAIHNAPDKTQLLAWLRHQPLMHIDHDAQYVLVHAGIPPQWNIETALHCANEIERFLQGENFLSLLQNMYGQEPSAWDNALTGWPRARYIINALTRMRFCTQSGKLDLNNKTAHALDSTAFRPWFDWQPREETIIFGHWAALEGQCNQARHFALDTGCVWGKSLTALRIEDKQRFSVPAQERN